MATKYSSYLNKGRVALTKSSRAMFSGVVSDFKRKDDKDMILLTDLVFLNRDGSFKLVSKTTKSRWFAVDDIVDLVVLKVDVDRRL